MAPKRGALSNFTGRYEMLKSHPPIPETLMKNTFDISQDILIFNNIIITNSTLSGKNPCKLLIIFFIISLIKKFLFEDNDKFTLRCA